MLKHRQHSIDQQYIAKWYSAIYIAIPCTRSSKNNICSTLWKTQCIITYEINDDSVKILVEEEEFIQPKSVAEDMY